MRGAISSVTVGIYVVLAVALVVVVAREPGVADAYLVYLVTALIVFLLARYLSTAYRLDAETLAATRILGGARMRLADVRKIEFAQLRELAPVGFFGAWGWRGRMWSPVTGAFDALYTAPNGLLITGGENPLFISPARPDEFARELSRRVRSHRGPLEVDAGRPAAPE
jgi:hypothetical protein